MEDGDDDDDENGEASTAAIVPVDSTASPTAFGDGMVLCDSCKMFNLFTKCRVISARQGAFRRTNCQNRMNVLRRHFDTWPTEQFRNLTEALSCDVSSSVGTYVDGESETSSGHRSPCL
jgi:hypothetical protein